MSLVPKHKLFDSWLAIEALVTIQNRVTTADRDLIGSMIAACTNNFTMSPYRGMKYPQLLKGLRDVGIVKSPVAPSKDACREVVNYFSNTRCYNAHTPVYGDKVLRTPQDTAKHFNYGSYTLDQVIKCPHLLEFALNNDILDIVGGYLGCLPTLYSMNTFWTFPISNPGLTHDYHRDEDDYKFLVVFVYWTDVEAGEGEFYFIPQTHDHSMMNAYIGSKRREGGDMESLLSGVDDFDALRRMSGGNGYGNADFYTKLFGNKMEQVAGEAGTTFISDTFGIHRGSRPQTRPRLTTWFRFGLYANAGYHAEKIIPVPRSAVEGRVNLDDARNKFICRLLIQDDTGSSDDESAAAPVQRDAKDPKTWGKVSRNEMCPCGSGKRYKHCHGSLS